MSPTLARCWGRWTLVRWPNVAPMVGRWLAQHWPIVGPTLACLWGTQLSQTQYCHCADRPSIIFYEITSHYQLNISHALSKNTFSKFPLLFRIREIHPLDPQPHRHSMLVPRVLVRATLTVALADVYYMLCLMAYTTVRVLSI